MKRCLRLLLLRILGLLARPFLRRPTTVVVELLYIKPDHLGDLLLATPVLAALRQRFPDAQITAIVGPWAEVVLRRNPDIDVLLTCPFPGFTRGLKIEDRGWKIEDGRLLSSILYLLSSILNSCRSLLRPYLTLLRYALLLRAGRYDLAIVGRDDHWWGAALALLAGVPQRVGFAVPECRPFLTDALPWDSRAHVTAQGLALVESVVSSPWSVVPGNGGTLYHARSTLNAQCRVGRRRGTRWPFSPGPPPNRTCPVAGIRRASGARSRAPE